MKSDEKILFQLLKNANKEKLLQFFEYIYSKYKPYVAFVCSLYVSSKEDIDDILQDVFLDFFNNLKNVRSSIKGYLLSSAKHRALNYLKKQNRLVITNDFEFCKLTTEDSFSHQVVLDLLNDMKKVLNGFEYEIIVMHLLDEYTFKEIATKLSKSEQTIKTKYYRALKKYNKRGNYNG